MDNDPSGNKAAGTGGGRLQQFVAFMRWAVVGLWGLMRLYHTQGLEGRNDNDNDNDGRGDMVGNNQNRNGDQDVGDVDIADAAAGNRAVVGRNTNQDGKQKIGNVKISRRPSPP